MLDRIDGAAVRRAGRVLPRRRLRVPLAGSPPYTGRVKRVALLGATGSIGRQAIEIVEAHPELELCAAASGSTPLDDVDAPLKEVGGDLTELLERAQPDVVLNAVVGFAGVHATLWALEHGVDLALANKESLVAAGELALAARERGRGRILPGRQRALGALPVPRGPRAGAGRHARAHRLGRPVPRPHARRARGRHARAGARTSDLAHGAEDHGGLRNAREQGARGDRGALPVRPGLRPHRGGDPADVDRALARPLPRRRRARASRLPGHARADLVRAHVPRARRDAAAAARPHLADARVLAARHRHVPDARRSRAPPGRRAAARRASTTPRTRSRSPRSSPAACRSSGSRRSWGRRSQPQTPIPSATSTTSSRPTARRGRSRKERWRRHDAGSS